MLLASEMRLPILMTGAAAGGRHNREFDNRREASKDCPAAAIELP
jgi:hypothetical protein